MVGQEHDDANRAASKVLLMADALITSQEDLKARPFRRSQQFSIPQFVPAVFVGSGNFVGRWRRKPTGTF